MTRLRIAALHVALPLTLGAASYFAMRSWVPLLGAHHAFWPAAPSLLRNHFADAAWAWSLAGFVSAMWMNEPRRARLFWYGAALAVAVSFELLQYAHVIAGSFDAADLAFQASAVIVAAVVTGGIGTWKPERRTA